MTKNTVIKEPVTFENTRMVVLPTPSRIELKKIDDIRLEMAKVYREMRTNKMEGQQGSRLVYVLSQIGKLIEISEIEQRISALETNTGSLNEHT